MLDHLRDATRNSLVDYSSFQEDEKKIYLAPMKRMTKNGNRPWALKQESLKGKREC